MYLAFDNKEKAIEFEKYLKSHSGRVFARKRFIGFAKATAGEPFF